MERNYRALSKKLTRESYGFGLVAMLSTMNSLVSNSTNVQGDTQDLRRGTRYVDENSTSLREWGT